MIKHPTHVIFDDVGPPEVRRTCSKALNGRDLPCGDTPVTAFVIFGDFSRILNLILDLFAE